MPRRRLHGETQKRRKKPQTRLLKRSDTPVRTQATQQPAPFERSPVVERDDLEFLEAMRELEVRRSPWRGDSLPRREAVEQVQFLAEEGEGALFLRSMAHLGVSPLAGEGAEPEASARGQEPPASASAPREPEVMPEAPVAQEAPAATPPARPAARSERASAPVEGTAFELEEDAGALMEALLRDPATGPELKFAGASAPPRRGNGARPEREDEGLEPDDELDLHGKTLEEAIRMVQNFLLVCHGRRLRHVLIITGRGRNSGAAGPVLKDAVYRWLELNGKRFARGFTRAPARLGGEGAIWITLR
jgi:hypothetical protein